MPPPPPPAVIYPPHYGYQPYNPEYAYPQALYSPLQQPHYYHQLYGPSPSSPSSSSPSAFYYGPYSLQVHPAQRLPVPPYLYYPPAPAAAAVDGAFSPYHAPLSLQPPVPPAPLLRHPFSSPTDSQSTPQPATPSETEIAAATTEGPSIA
ncbi:hypothetical protein SAY86_028777 [Trapa natans]|uniref:Uncharacterized protein n=1 Tax=Trapa natans TaxID=22666 RepID=A0AAN7M035_TRANT|nr:hypothetical protein SAY86_028777 [Trapa natans]